ncbi:MAG: SDR family oxidoreductase [Leptolyngbyaceae bacterium]|nr:SDR family oxidoreductase [Leptolyngbyaceae bacterium]
MATSLITGASSGIGAAFAEAMAARGDALILVARSQDKLDALAQRLRQRHGSKVETIVQDLTADNAAEAIAHTVDTLNLTVDILVNNAGFGDYGAFHERDRTKQLDMIRLNILALTDLTYQFLPAMVQRRSGHIINVGSIASFQPIPYMAIYAATKAFVLSFSEALWVEVEPFGVKVLALCPGPTTTNFQAVAEFPDSMGNQAARLTMAADAVVAEAMASLDSGVPNLVNGGPINQFLVNVSRFLPRSALVKSIGQQFRPQT